MKFNLDLYIDAIFTASRDDIDAIFTASRDDIDAVIEALEDNGIVYDIINDDADGVQVDAKCEDLKELKKLEKLLKSV